MRSSAAGREWGVEDGLCFSTALSEKRVAFQIVLLCCRRCSELAEIVLQVAEVGHDLRNADGAGVVD